MIHENTGLWSMKTFLLSCSFWNRNMVFFSTSGLWQDLNCVNILNPVVKSLLYPLCTFLSKCDSPSHLLFPHTWTSSVRQTWTNLFIHSKFSVCVCVWWCVTWHSSVFLLGSFIGGIKISSAPKQVSWSVCLFQGLKTLTMRYSARNRHWPSFSPGGHNYVCFPTYVTSSLILTTIVWGG